MPHTLLFLRNVIVWTFILYFYLRSNVKKVLLVACFLHYSFVNLWKTGIVFVFLFIYLFIINSSWHASHHWAFEKIAYFFFRQRQSSIRIRCYVVLCGFFAWMFWLRFWLLSSLCYLFLIRQTALWLVSIPHSIPFIVMSLFVCTHITSPLPSGPQLARSLQCETNSSLWLWFMQLCIYFMFHILNSDFGCKMVSLLQIDMICGWCLESFFFWRNDLLFCHGKLIHFMFKLVNSPLPEFWNKSNSFS